MNLSITKGTLNRIQEVINSSTTNYLLPANVTTTGATNNYSRTNAFEANIDLTNITSTMTIEAQANRILGRKDLSTLGLSAGQHQIKAKAKANNYNDSDFSNTVTYTAD